MKFVTPLASVYEPQSYSAYCTHTAAQVCAFPLYVLQLFLLSYITAKFCCMCAGVHRDDADSVRSVGCGILYTQGMLHV